MLISRGAIIVGLINKKGAIVVGSLGVVRRLVEVIVNKELAYRVD